MNKLLLLLFVISAVGATSPKGAGGCTSRKDKRIVREQGATFASRFRDFGGLWVSRATFEERVREATSLSVSCASCYGASYVCGYDNCYLSCAMEGSMCTSCLERNGCVAACNLCITHGTGSGQ